MTIPSKPLDSVAGRARHVEAEHVHDVYDAIAGHFSSTRYSPWPVVRDFLLSLPAGSVGVDVGCGNGKYLGCNPDVLLLGNDRSPNLVDICRERGLEALVCDGLALPYISGRFDFCICIAVVHHMSTAERRVEALRSLLQTLRPGGVALVFVWALEQKTSRRGWDQGDPQDIMVPWKTTDEDGKERVYERYYHLYKRGDLERDIASAGGAIVEGRSGYDRDNWWAVFTHAQV